MVAVSVVCCDTSFLFSLYARDAHTSKALTLTKQFSKPLTISTVNEFEFCNALRFTAFRKLMPASDVALIIAAFESDIATGKLIVATCNLAEVFTEAKRLSANYTLKGGHRAFDMLHVAAAIQLGASEFFSFDANQRKLAKAAGLKVKP